MGDQTQASTPKKKPPVRYLCDCDYKCGRLTVIDEVTGKSRPGQLVSSTTRSNHRKRDELASRALQPAQIIDNTSGTLGMVVEDNARVQAQGGGESEVEIEMDPVGGHITDPMTTVAGVTKVLHSSVSALGTWLYLAAGLSRASVNRTLKAIDVIVGLAIKLGQISASTSSVESTPCIPISLSLPHDVRTAINKLSLDPKLSRTICCPKCFKQYALNHIPEQCTFRATPRSRKAATRSNLGAGIVEGSVGADAVDDDGQKAILGREWRSWPSPCFKTTTEFWLMSVGGGGGRRVVVLGVAAAVLGYNDRRWWWYRPSALLDDGGRERLRGWEPSNAVVWGMGRQGCIGGGWCDSWQAGFVNGGSAD